MRHDRNFLLALTACLGLAACGGMDAAGDCAQLERSLGYSGDDCGGNETADMSSEYIGLHD